jgi:aerobic-type carbon monoxide dehydrogenase small subunit (CoxS/CutS family)
LLNATRRSSALRSADIEASITNICRCGTYARIKRAILTLHQ